MTQKQTNVFLFILNILPPNLNYEGKYLYNGDEEKKEFTFKRR